MGYTLIIAEKPDAARRIAEAIADEKPKTIEKNEAPYYEFTVNGKKHVCVPAVGHLFVLSPVRNEGNKGWNYPIFDLQWVPTYMKKETEWTRKYFENIRSLVKGADEFIDAADVDTEGEVLLYNILRFICGVEDAKRMKFSTLTKDELVESYKNMDNHIMFPMLESGLTRHALDALWGFNLTRALTLALKNHAEKGFAILSSGRVQSPTLALLLEREMEIRKFVPKPFWQLELHCKANGTEITAMHEKEKFWKKGEVDKILKDCQGKDAKVEEIKKKKYRQKPPFPFNTTDLQAECYDEKTRVFTRDGFKYFYELTYDDEIATLNPKTHCWEYQKPTKIIGYDYEGNMIYFQGQNYNLLVTPNHNMYAKAFWQKSFQFIKAMEFLNHKDYIFEIKKDACWIGKDIKDVEIPAITGPHVINIKSVPTEVWIRFFGWWITEGFTSKRIWVDKKGKWGRKGSSHKQYCVGIANQDPKNLEEVCDLVRQLGFTPVMQYNSSVPRAVIFSSKQLQAYLSQFGKAQNKFIPPEIKNLPPEKLKTLFSTMFRGDGNFLNDKPRTYFTSSKRLAEDMVEIAIKCGYGASIIERSPGSWKVGISNLRVTPRVKRPRSIYYRGKVYCVTVPNHIILVERNGMVCWSGNSYAQFKFSPTQTMMIAESLYQQGFISYPRSSSQKLPPTIDYQKILGALASLPQYKKFCEMLLKKEKLVPNEGPRTDPAHPAVYATHEVPDLKKLTPQQKKLYDLIVRRTLVTFADEALRESVNAILAIDGNKFVAVGKRTIEPGWTEIYSPYLAFEEQILPELKVGQTLKVIKIDLLAKETQPPGRYSQGSIIKEMEKRGLGTRATRAEILQTLYDRRYILGKSIQVTKLGETVTKVLKEFCPRILSEELTRHFEKEMDLVFNGKKKREEVVEEAKKFLLKVLKDFKKNEEKIGKKLLEGLQEARKEERRLGTCLNCKTGEMRIFFSRKTMKRFAGCSNYPKCKTGFPLPATGQITPLNKACEVCGWPMIQVWRKGKRPFRMCINHKCKSKEGWSKSKKHFENEMKS